MTEVPKFGMTMALVNAYLIMLVAPEYENMISPYKGGSSCVWQNIRQSQKLEEYKCKNALKVSVLCRLLQ